MRGEFSAFAQASTETKLRNLNRVVVTGLGFVVMLSVGVWGWTQASTKLWHFVLLFLFMLLPLALFSMLLNPESRFYVSGRSSELTIKALWLTLGAVALFATGHQTLALVFEALVAVCLPLGVAWDQI